MRSTLKWKVKLKLKQHKSSGIATRYGSDGYISTGGNCASTEARNALLTTGMENTNNHSKANANTTEPNRIFLKPITTKAATPKNNAVPNGEIKLISNLSNINDGLGLMGCIVNDFIWQTNEEGF